MFSSRWFRFFCWFTVAGWAGTIFYCSTLTGSQVERLNVWGWWDKALHFLIFAVGGVVVAFTLFRTTTWHRWTILKSAALALSAYGWSDEWHQQFTPGRSAQDVGDWTADTLGGVTGALILILLYAQRPRAPRTTPPAN